MLINTYKIPKDEAGVKALHILGILFAGNKYKPTPFSADIYDVTDGIHYVGAIEALEPVLDVRDSWKQYTGAWLEYDAPAGKRTLMLANFQGISSGIDLFHDFIEITVVPNKVQHISLSQYGVFRKPYFGIINFSDDNYKFCSTLPDADDKNLHELINNYMLSTNINIKAWDFANYCLALGKNVNVLTTTTAGLARFDTIKDKANDVFNKNYSLWKNQHDQVIEYDLMKVYEEPKQQSGLFSSITSTDESSTLPKSAKPSTLPEKPIPPTQKVVIPTEKPVATSEKLNSSKLPITKLDIFNIKNPAAPDLAGINQLVISYLISKLQNTCMTEINGFPGLNTQSQSNQTDNTHVSMKVKPEASGDNGKITVLLYRSKNSSSNSTLDQNLWKASIPVNINSSLEKKELAQMVANSILDLMIKDKLIETSCNNTSVHSTQN